MSDHDKLTDEQLDELSNQLKRIKVRLGPDYESAKLHLAILASEGMPDLIDEIRELRQLRDEVEPVLREAYHKVDCLHAEEAIADILARHFGKEGWND